MSRKKDAVLSYFHSICVLYSLLKIRFPQGTKNGDSTSRYDYSETKRIQQIKSVSIAYNYHKLLYMLEFICINSIIMTFTLDLLPFMSLIICQFRLCVTITGLERCNEAGNRYSHGVWCSCDRCIQIGLSAFSEISHFRILPAREGHNCKRTLLLLLVLQSSPLSHSLSVCGCTGFIYPAAWETIQWLCV